jgi:Mn-dependent DtxR family transcriptional regulator
VSPNEMKALKALADARSEYEDFCYLSFKGIAKRSGLDPSLVRRTVRSLARKGFAEYGRGLWTDEGEMAGSGYCCTKAGAAALPPAESAPPEKTEASQ